MSAFGICKMNCFIYLMFVYMFIFHVFYGGPHGRIADRLNENIVNTTTTNNNNNVIM